MKKLYSLLLLTILPFSVFAFGPISITRTNISINTRETKHNYWQASFAVDYGIPEYVQFNITKEEAFNENIAQRKSGKTFKKEPSITKVVKHESYTNSGYQRGHMCDADIMDFNQKAMDDTFYVTNICPQMQFFNISKAWRYSETITRQYARQYGEVYVLVGPVIDKNASAYKTLKNEGIVSIPEYFFKVYFILDEDNENELLRAEYYIFPHNDTIKNKELIDFRVTEQKFLEVTGLKVEFND